MNKIHIENIVIATLISNKDKYWSSVRCCLTPDMFSDINKMLFQDLQEDKAMDLLALNERYPDNINEIVSMVVDDDFDANLWEYNFNQRLFSSAPKYSTVSFDDYVTTLIKIYYEQLDRCAGATA